MVKECLFIYLEIDWLSIASHYLPYVEIVLILWKPTYKFTRIQFSQGTSGLQCFSFPHDVIAFEVSVYLSSQRKESPIKKSSKTTVSHANPTQMHDIRGSFKGFPRKFNK